MNNGPAAAVRAAVVCRVSTCARETRNDSYCSDLRYRADPGGGGGNVVQTTGTDSGGENPTHDSLDDAYTHARVIIIIYKVTCIPEGS